MHWSNLVADTPYFWFTKYRSSILQYADSFDRAQELSWYVSDKHIAAKVSEWIGEADSTLLDCRVKSKWEL